MEQAQFTSSASTLPPTRMCRCRPARRLLALLALAICLAWTSSVLAAPHSKQHPFAKHFLVLQLSDSSQAKQGKVLSVANNLIKHYGPDLIDIQVVTFGPGVHLLFADNDNKERVNSLVAQGVRFIVCMNTIDTIERTTGSKPDLNKHAIPVQVGVAYILEQVEDGYTLVRP